MKRKYSNIDKDTFCSLYEVSSDGKITSKITGYEYVPSTDRKGYKILRLPYPDSTNKDGRRPFKVHRIVAMVYLPNYSEELQVNHKNGIKTDNRVFNLEMVTCQRNILHSWRELDSGKRRAMLSKRNSLRKDVIKRMVCCASLANKKSVGQFDDNMKLLNEYESISEATNKMKLKSLSAISYAVRNNTKSAGFYWKYL